MSEHDGAALVEGLFRRESAHLVAALTRWLGPSRLALAEDVVHEALISAMQAWRFGPPDNPKAWLLQTAKHRAIDRLRRERRFHELSSELAAEQVSAALADSEDAANQLAMMFSICDASLSLETHVTLILRFLCGLSPAEIARAFLVDTQTIDRRLHRGRARLRELGQLADVQDSDDVRARQPSVMQALYLLFNEGYHGSDAQEPLHPALCADALRLSEWMLERDATADVAVHALAALFCFHAARLPTRLDARGVLVPLAEQDRSRWDRALIARGVLHLSASAGGAELTRWHLEAGIACEHAQAASVRDTDWQRIVALYDALQARAPSPIVLLNRALAIAELHGFEAGRQALQVIAQDEKMAGYHFFWAAQAELSLRAGRTSDARKWFERAIALAHNEAERKAYQRKIKLLDD
jgi:RNA polymerase sigma factor (sigma-70 family)